MQSDTLRVFKAQFKAQAKSQLRYKPNLTFNIANSVLYAFIMLLYIPFYSSAVQSEAGTYNVVSYVLLGSVILGLSMMMNETRGIIRDQLEEHSIAYTLSSPVSRFKYFFAVSLSGGIWDFIFEIPVFLIAVIVVIGTASMTGVLLGFLSIFLSVLIMLFIGLCFGALELAYKDMGGVPYLIGTLSSFLSGAVIPIAMFPIYLQYASFAFPQTAGLYLARYYLSGSILVLPTYVLWLIMIGEVVFFGMLAWSILKYAEKKSKKEGLRRL